MRRVLLVTLHNGDYVVLRLYENKSHAVKLLCMFLSAFLANISLWIFRGFIFNSGSSSHSKKVMAAASMGLMLAGAQDSVKRHFHSKRFSFVKGLPARNVCSGFLVVYPLLYRKSREVC